MMTNKTCDEVRELLSLHLDNELDDLGRGRVRRHLATCATCTSHFEQLRAVDQLFRQPPMRVAPPDFTSQAVAAAFEAQLRRNLWLGFLVLMVGTLVIGSLALLGRVDLIWAIASSTLAPGFWSNGGAWLTQMVEMLAVVGRVGLNVAALLGDLMIGPLFVPSLVTLLSAAFFVVLIRRLPGSGQRAPQRVSS